MQNNYANRGRQELEYAGFWVRLAAYVIDLAIVWIGLLFVKLVLGILSLAGGTVFQARLLFQYTLRDIILYLLQAAYFILLTCYTGTTPGKRLMNLTVVNADGSQRLGLMNVAYRETVGRFLCGLSIGIGYIMAGVDREKRGLHDMLCDTRVIYGKKIKVIPKYQALAGYPPIPPVPPMPPKPPVPPYGKTSWGNGPPDVYDPVSPYGRSHGNMPENGYGPIPPEGSPTPGNGYGPIPPEGSPRQENKGANDRMAMPPYEKEPHENPEGTFRGMPEDGRIGSKAASDRKPPMSQDPGKEKPGKSSGPVNVSDGTDR